MYQKEEIINLWFKMWIYKKDLGMENIFSQNIKYKIYRELWCKV